MNERRDSESIDRSCVAGGAALACLAVLLGAFGAHALKGSLGPEALGWWQTAVEYQMWHALALLGIGFAGLPGARVAGGLLGGGTLLFSGSLYAMALGAPRLLGAVTPLGGMALIAGWMLLAFRFWPRRD